MGERGEDLPLVGLERADGVFSERHGWREAKKLLIGRWPVGWVLLFE